MENDKAIATMLFRLADLDPVRRRNEVVELLQELEFQDDSSPSLRAAVAEGYYAVGDHHSAMMHVAIGLSLFPDFFAFYHLAARTLSLIDPRYKPVATRLLEIGWRKRSWKNRRDHIKKQNFFNLDKYKEVQA